MATPTDRYAVVRTATPGSVADYQAPGDCLILAKELAAYGQPIDGHALGAWEQIEWDRLAERAIGVH